MSTIDIELLIAEIAKRRAIWMQNHADYKSRPELIRLWKEINEIFPEYKVLDLKKKWKNVKDTYRKELKKQQKEIVSADGVGYESSWKYFNLMEFYKEELNDITDEGNSNHIDHEFDAQSQLDPLTDHFDVSDVKPPLEVPYCPPSHGAPQPEPVSPQEKYEQDSDLGVAETSQPNRKRRADCMRAEYLEIAIKKLRILEQEVARQNSKNAQPDVEKTGDYYFLMSLLPEMQKLPIIQKIRLRNKINQLLIDEIAATSPNANCEFSVFIKEEETLL